MPVVTQIHTNGLADNSVTDEKINNSDTFNFTGTSIFNAGSSTFTMPSTRPSSGYGLKANDANGNLTWAEISVSGYQGVNWDWKVDGGGTQTIGDGKCIVIPGPMEITNGTVIVSASGAGGRLHIL